MHEYTTKQKKIKKKKTDEKGEIEEPIPKEVNGRKTETKMKSEIEREIKETT